MLNQKCKSTKQLLRKKLTIEKLKKKTMSTYVIK